MNPNKRRRLAEEAEKEAQEYRNRNEHLAAARTFTKAAELWKGFDELKYAQALYHAGSLFGQVRKYTQAESDLNKSLSIFIKHFNSDHQDVAACYHELAIVYRETGNSSNAEKLYQKALDIRKKELPEDSPDIAATLNNLANLYSNQKRYKEAQPLLEEAVRILEKHFHKSHQSIAKPLNNLALIYNDNGENLKAEEYLERAALIDSQYIAIESISNYFKLLPKLKESRKKLAETEKLVSLGRLSTMMAHNINTPVGIIRAKLTGALDDLEQGLFHRDELKPLLESTLKQVQRLHDIVAKFRQSAKSGEAQQELIDLNVLIQDVASFAKEQLIAHHIELDLQLEQDSQPLVLGNSFELQEILVNLISNAKEALDKQARAKIWIKTWVAQDKAGFQVEDNGMGIPAENQKDLFLPFMSRKSEGTGLGLYTAHQAIQAMKGKLEYRPSSAGGACFIISLPREQKEHGT